MPRRNLLSSAAVVVAAAVAVAPGTAAAGRDAKPKRFHCTIEAIAQGVPNPSGIHLGFTGCPKPFGKGLHFNAYTVTSKPSPGVPGAVSGTFKNYYNRGTTRGTFAMTIVASSQANLTYSGTVTYTGGTAAFRRVKGGGTIQCTTTDGGTHKSCAVNSTLTGV
jgi:hypothetical protein